VTGARTGAAGADSLDSVTEAWALVVQSDAEDGPGVVGEWLTAAGLPLRVVRADQGEPVPAALDGAAALVVLGAAADDEPWYPAVEELLRTAVAARVPVFALCLGAQLLARALGGRVDEAEAGPEIGARLVGKRDAAASDALLADVPLMPDVIQWHHNEISELPVGATLLAASPSYPHQAFRYGERAWGVQFHLECDAEMLTSWFDGGRDELAALGYDDEDAAVLLDRCLAVLPDIEEVWRPVVTRFADLALGRLSYRTALPLLDQ
jgi:GMP synthase-like glutamine amidotransferase